LPRLKEELDINIELAAPDHFVPTLPGWRERCQFIVRQGRLSFYHYDFYSQALAKIERAHTRDRNDVGKMIESGLVQPGRLAQLFAEVELQIIRYPAIDLELLRKRVAAIAASEAWT
jgi:hypothetical protein